MASRFESAGDARDRLESQQRILELLTSLPHNSYEPEEVLVLVQKSGIHRAALLLHQEGASSWGKHSESEQELEHRAYHFKAAIDCYLDDDDPDFCKEVFAYVKKECSGISSDYQQSDLKDDTYQHNSLRTALACKLADLVQLDSLLTSELVAELFADDLDSVVSQLHDEQAQFLFFQAIISGDLDEKDQVAGAVLNANLTVDHHHRYLELMAKLHPDDVYDYLQTHDSYRPEACLPLCQKYDIADASCYLLERMGNVSSGLQLILQTLESRMMGLKRIIRGMGTTSTYGRYHAGIRHHKLLVTSSNSVADTVMGATEREIQGVKRILIVALDLCERNSGTFSTRTEHGSQLWFNVLDRLINAKGFLRLSKEQPGHARIMAGVLSDLLRLVMQRMVSSVPLPDLVRKVTSDHSGSRLGELREMVESLLSTYGFELTLFEGAVRVFHHDMKQMRGRNRSLRIRGDRVSSLMTAPISDTTNTNDRKWNEENSISLPVPSATNASEGDNQGFGTAVLKLQRRREQQQRLDKYSNSATKRHPSHRVMINFMPESERRIFVDGEENPDATYWEDRMAGLLGSAENSGRFRSFLY
jgi:vacuolar protein sorting-associated protein 8